MHGRDAAAESLPGRSDELMKVAAMPLSSSSRTWSCISAINGDTTMLTPGLEQRRQLKAQRFAAAGGHEGKHVPAGQGIPDDGLLAGTKILESKNAMQRCGQVGHGAAFYRTVGRCTA